MDVEIEQPRPGAPALLALGIMLAIALVAAGAVLAWARLGAPSATAEDPATLDEPLPASLADGSPLGDVPPVVAAVVDAPVVGATRLDAVPGDLDVDCIGDPTTEEITFEAGFVTPDVAAWTATARAAGFGPDELTPVRLVCTADPVDGAWQGGGGGSIAPVAGGHGVGISSTGDGRMLATSVLDLPEGTAWVVEDRGEYRLAYPVDGLPALPLARSYREGLFDAGRVPSAPVLLLDDGGGVLEEVVVGG